MTDDLEARYHAYLAVLNERRLDDLVHFVHERLTYNDEEITGRGYRDMIAADIAAVPDLVFDPHLVVVSGDRVACRLVFRCTPRDDVPRVHAGRRAGLLRRARLLPVRRGPHRRGDLADRSLVDRDPAPGPRATLAVTHPPRHHLRA